MPYHHAHQPVGRNNHVGSSTGIGGAGVSNAGTITSLTNKGVISGGSGGFGNANPRSYAGAGVWNAQGATTIGSLINQATGTISGGGGASSSIQGAIGDIVPCRVAFLNTAGGERLASRAVIPK